MSSSDARCNGITCRRPIRFVKIEMFDHKTKTVVKRPHPIDALPDRENGNIVVVGDEGVRIGKAKKALMLGSDQPPAFYVDHFKTCPDAEDFRAKSKRKASHA